MSSLVSARFNPAGDCLCVSSSHGLSVYSLDTAVTCCHSLVVSGMALGTVLGHSALVAAAGSGAEPQFSPRTLRLYDTQRRDGPRLVCSVTVDCTILNIAINESRLVVVTRTEALVFDVRTVKLVHTIPTAANPLGLFALSDIATERCVLAVPAPSLDGNRDGESGDVLVFDAHSLQSMARIRAHTHSLRALCLSSDGRMLATASERGTVLRVHDTGTGKLLHTLRRGTLPAATRHLTFNHRHDRLCVASENSRTVHIFDLRADADTSSDAPPSVTVTMSSLFTALAPARVSDLVSPARSVVSFQAPSLPLSAAFVRCPKPGRDRVAVVTAAQSPSHAQSARPAILAVYEILANSTTARLETEIRLEPTASSAATAI